MRGILCVRCILATSRCKRHGTPANKIIKPECNTCEQIHIRSWEALATTINTTLSLVKWSSISRTCSFKRQEAQLPLRNRASMTLDDLEGPHFGGGRRKMHVFWNRVHNGPSRLSKVIDFGTNRKRVCDFLLVINSNLGTILPRFRDIAGFPLRRATPPQYHPTFWETESIPLSESNRFESRIVMH